MLVTCGRLYQTYERFWQRPELDGLVSSFLVLMHQVVRASVPLMEFTQALCASGETEVVCRRLVPYLGTHIEEERHHDEWLLDDLVAAGISRDQVFATMPSRRVATLVGAQYYWVRHFHPVALVGYMRVLEGNPPSDAHIERLQLASGLPPDTFRTYRLHGSADPDHLRDLDALLDALPLSKSQLQLVWLSASHTADALADCLDDVERECRARHQRLIPGTRGIGSVRRPSAADRADALVR
jgi:hypothetical protein